MVQFGHLQFVVINLNYNLYIHVKINFLEFIYQITPPKYSNYFIF